MENLLRKAIVLISSLALVSCGGGGGVTIQPGSETFNLESQVNDKIDILWVVDCSVSMANEIQNVRDNISDFMTDFTTLGYDFRIGVITTTAWSHYAYLADNNLSELTKFNLLHTGEATSRDSTNGGALPKYIDPANPDVLGNFDINFDIDAAGHCGDLNTSGMFSYIGDERGMQSLRAFIDYSPDLSSFLRDDSFFAIIMIADEKDGSRDYLVPDIANGNNDPGGPIYHDPADYQSYLTNYFQGNSDRFRAYAITKISGQPFIDSYHSFAQGSGGFVVDIDDPDYSEELSQITTNIIEVASQFPLQSTPIESSLQVSYTYDDMGTPTTVQVPKDDTEVNGYKYFSVGNYVAFFGTYRPPANSSVSIVYDPTSL